MFPHGLSTSSLASGDPFAQFRLKRGSLPQSTSTPIPSKSDRDSNARRHPHITPIIVPPPLPTFSTYRPPIIFTKRTASQRKRLQRKLLFAHRHRFRIWFNEARTRRRQLKKIAEIRTQFAGDVTNDAERAAISLSPFISLSSVLYKIRFSFAFMKKTSALSLVYTVTRTIRIFSRPQIPYIHFVLPVVRECLIILTS